jgi:hypothetical protein
MSDFDKTIAKSCLVDVVECISWNKVDLQQSQFLPRVIHTELRLKATNHPSEEDLVGGYLVEQILTDVRWRRTP